MSFIISFLLSLPLNWLVLFLQFVSCPEGPRSIPLLCRSILSSFLSQPTLSMSGSSSPFTRPTAQAHLACPSCASSGSCLPRCIIGTPRECSPTHSASTHNPSASVWLMMMNFIDPMNVAMTHHVLKQPFHLKSREEDDPDFNPFSVFTCT